MAEQKKKGVKDMTEKNKKYLKVLRTMASPFGWLTIFSFLGIPFGLVFWLFNPIGWKIALGSLIALPFLMVIVLSFRKAEENFKAEHEDDEDEDEI